MNELDAAGPICILTPTGIMCMESPLKWHLPFGHPCIDEPVPSDPEKRDLRVALIDAIAAAFDKTAKHAVVTDEEREKHRTIAAIAVFINEASRVFPDQHFDPRGPFTLVKGARAPA